MKAIRPTVEQIRRRAYEIYLQRGGQPGHEVDDWLQAEYELMHLPTEKIATLEPPKLRKGNNGRKSVITIVRDAMLPPPKPATISRPHQSA